MLSLPGVGLAIVGITHPTDLTHHSAEHWWVMHVVLLPIFPLLGLALVGVLMPRRDALARLILLLVYIYCLFYGALDVLNGIGAGFVVARDGSQESIPSLFAIGNDLATYGVWAFLVAAVIVAADQIYRHRLAAVLPALLLVAGSISFLDSHIYRWRGVVTVLAIGVATGWLAWVARTPAARVNTESSSMPT